MPLKDIAFFISPNLKIENENIFSSVAHSVAWKYCNELNDVNIKHLRKITIDLSNRARETRIIGYPFDSVCIIEQYYDFDHFFSLNEEDKKIELLNIIQNNITLAANKFNWSIEQFEQAYNTILQNGFENIYFKGKKVTNPSRKMTAQIEINAIPKYALISVLITDKLTSREKRIEVIKVSPDPMYVDSIVKKIKWTGNSEVLLEDTNGEITFKIDCDSDSSELILAPKIHSENYLKEMLIIADAYESKDVKLEIIRNRMEQMRSGHYYG